MGHHSSLAGDAVWPLPDARLRGTGHTGLSAGRRTGRWGERMASFLERGPAHLRPGFRDGPAADICGHVEQLFPAPAGDERPKSLPVDRKSVDLERPGPGL